MVEQGEGENIILQEDCSEDEIGSGYLTLTNQRLIFQKGEARMLTLSRKTTKVAMEVPLNKIRYAKTEGWLAKKVVVEVSEEGEHKLYKFGVFSPGKWRDTIEDAIKASSSSR
ncbi:MAG: hypothetical protein ACE5KA_07365 [Nitrososphaerales archaeon]